MDLAGLRHLLRMHLVPLKDQTTHRTLPELCAQIGLPEPPAEGSKYERLSESVEAIPDSDVASIAARFIDECSPSAPIRNGIQEVLWANDGPEVPKRVRREVAQRLHPENLYQDAERFDQLLDSLFVIDRISPGYLFTGRDDSLHGLIQQHVHRNPGDWSPDRLFDKIGAYDCSSRRFRLLIEGLASSDVRPDAEAQLQFVGEVNHVLRKWALELRQTGSDGGYPVFTVVTHSAKREQPKNLIFASSRKPDLRFRDSVSNDVEIVTNADKVLIYDRPIGAEGLRWRDLQSWWSHAQGIDDPRRAKETLYRRLESSLPPDSPPQRFLFRSFFENYGSEVPNLPALLPEIWLHWDPKTVAERGRDALLHSRMDFLMLFPGGVRIVLEVDGKHHYSDSRGYASPAKYAKMARGDRDLELRGYEVYRFGAQELRAEHSAQVLAEFYQALFDRHGIVRGE